MIAPLNLPALDERAVTRLAEIVALKLRPGDIVTLDGDLGAGKTTFARALIRALMGDREVEVPSPTFSLVQHYRTPRLDLVHSDLYRLNDPDEIAELGLGDAARSGAVLIEWPQRGHGFASLGEVLGIAFADDSDAPHRRHLTLTPSAAWSSRMERIAAIAQFLDAHCAARGFGDARIDYLQGDASPRSYARLTAGVHRAILMDAPRQPDGPPIRDGLPYSRIAHLAEDVRPFVAIDGVLREAGFSAPEIFAADLDAGLLLIEDLGAEVFGAALECGATQRALWTAATDVLVALRRMPVPHAIGIGSGAVHTLPDYDRRALSIEAELFVDWYWPALHGAPVPPEVRAQFGALWDELFDSLLAMPRGLVLRDYHSPNLMWLPQRPGVANVGILDFQDAMTGPWAYDVVSLLQDARLDVAPDLEAHLFEHYCTAA
ncbi:MAG: tRNA (adenosine(37)-N6)-threonylcarbamoyltransferase complex ATPase subunit type 1 TsaE, partial [Hyphomicrobium sp.]